MTEQQHFFERTIEASSEDYTSVSRITTWINCPQNFYYRYIANAPQELTSVALVFGKAGHEVIERTYIGIRNDYLLGIDEVAQLAADAWERELEAAHNQAEKVLYSSKPNMDTPGKVKDRLIGMMRHWHEYAVMPDEVLATEQRFRANIIDPRTGEVRKTQIVGIVDAVTRRKNELVLEEHKTAGRKWSEGDFSKSLQATVYLATNREVSYLLFNILTKTKTPGLQQENVWRSGREKELAADTICGVMDAIDAGIRFRTKDWQCNGCAFRRRCWK